MLPVECAHALAAEHLLVFNAGSSSIRFGLYDNSSARPRTLRNLLRGKVDRIGLEGATLTVADARTGRCDVHSASAGDHAEAFSSLLDRLEPALATAPLAAVGHRIVHGAERRGPARIDAALLADLQRMAPVDPEHMPAELALIEAVALRDPRVPQIACFDTSFHHAMPPVARVLPIPRRYAAAGVRRHGFHGLSCASVVDTLARGAGARDALGRVIVAHLGGGASVTAILDGRSVDSSMGFSPGGGIPMGTRSGDLDPGLAAHLERTEQLSAADFFTMTHRASGLLGVSETSADMADLLASRGRDVRAAEAVAMFCYRSKQQVGAYAAVLGGIDTLVFTGGIGENAAAVRAAVCEGLGFLGLVLDPARNAANADVISADGSGASIRIVRTDEESVIAFSTACLLGLCG